MCKSFFRINTFWLLLLLITLLSGCSPDGNATIDDSNQNVDSDNQSDSKDESKLVDENMEQNDDSEKNEQELDSINNDIDSIDTNDPLDEDSEVSDGDSLIDEESYYYPPLSGNEWEIDTRESVGLISEKLDDLTQFIGENNSTAFIILYKGRIVVEEYWNDWDIHTSELIYSAAKSITSILIGIAIDEGLLGIDDKVSDLIGVGWSGAPQDKEEMIKVWHLLTMTSGLEDKKELGYVADAGTVNYYNTKVYYVLGDILEKITGSRDNFTKSALLDKIGMTNSQWVVKLLGNINTMESSARDMARFGHLVLSKGNWDGNQIVSNDWINEATNSSQELNPSYGYLFWLNGKESYIPPKKEKVVGSAIPEGPADMVMALGAQDKKIYIIPSLDMVVIRHGDAADASTLAGSEFDNAIWERLSKAFK